MKFGKYFRPFISEKSFNIIIIINIGKAEMDN